MAKIPVQPILKAAKTAIPRVIEIAKQNPKETLAILGGTGKVVKGLIKDKDKKFQDKKSKGKVPYRKIQYRKYHNEVLPNLDSFTYIQLNTYKQEVENYIKQISQEEVNELAINKPIHSKRTKSWKQVLIQIEDKIKNRNYEELLKAYNSSTYANIYFDDKVINNMRNIENKKELFKYIHQYSERNLNDIERDFS